MDEKAMQAVVMNRYEREILDRLEIKFVYTSYRPGQYEVIFGTSDSSNVTMKMEVFENKPKINLLNTKRDVSFEE